MFSSQIRTDLALDAHETAQTTNPDAHSPIHGVEVQEHYHKKSNTQIHLYAKNILKKKKKHKKKKKIKKKKKQKKKKKNKKIKKN